MTRMFTGNRGDSSNTNPLFNKYEKHSAKQAYINKMRGVNDAALSPEERYKKNLDKKMNELRNQAMGNSKYRFTLPGTEGGEERKLSKTAEAFLKRMAEKQLKEEERKERERMQIVVKAKSFTGMQGGRIDKKGKIYGPDNKWVGSVNLKTGKVTNRWGNKICKYDANSPYAEYQIAQYIAKEYNKNKGNLYGTKGHGGMMSNGGIHGTAGFGGGGMGNFYGTKPSKGNSFWG